MSSAIELDELNDEGAIEEIALTPSGSEDKGIDQYTLWVLRITNQTIFMWLIWFNLQRIFWETIKIYPGNRSLVNITP